MAFRPLTAVTTAFSSVQFLFEIWESFNLYISSLSFHQDVQGSSEIAILPANLPSKVITFISFQADLSEMQSGHTQEIRVAKSPEAVGS